MGIPHSGEIRYIAGCGSIMEVCDRFECCLLSPISIQTTNQQPTTKSILSCCAVKLYLLKKSRIGSNPSPLPILYSLFPVFIIRFSRLSAYSIAAKKIFLRGCLIKSFKVSLPASFTPFIIVAFKVELPSICLIAAATTITFSNGVLVG